MTFVWSCSCSRTEWRHLHRDVARSGPWFDLTHACHSVQHSVAFTLILSELIAVWRLQIWANIRLSEYYLRLPTNQPPDAASDTEMQFDERLRRQNYWQPKPELPLWNEVSASKKPSAVINSSHFPLKMTHKTGTGLERVVILHHPKRAQPHTEFYDRGL